MQAEAEDALEKLSVTPGPIVPAPEQLGQLLLELQRPREALIELTQALTSASVSMDKTEVIQPRATHWPPAN
jgi:hypothetical protein